MPALTWSTRTTTPCRRRCGNCTPMPYAASARSRRWSNGMIAFPPSRRWSPRPNAPVRLKPRCSVPVVKLRELQQLFWDSLAGAPMSIAPGLADAVVPGPALDSRERVGIYADAYAARLIDVLRENFPRVTALLG